jgi:hypothetical protein
MLRSEYDDYSADASLFETVRHIGASGVVRGPGVNVWHMGLAKAFLFTDKTARLGWEISATNIFNHPNWNNPGLTNAASSGVITSTGLQNGSTGDGREHGSSVWGCGCNSKSDGFSRQPATMAD